MFTLTFLWKIKINTYTYYICFDKKIDILYLKLHLNNIITQNMLQGKFMYNFKIYQVKHFINN